MRNIEALKNYFLGKDPQLKETMADNSLRLIGIPGREFALRSELFQRLKQLRDELLEKDKELADKIDEAIQEIEELAKKIPFTTLTSDLHIYQDQPMDPSWESGWYDTGEYKVYWADTVEPIAFEHTLFYYNNAPGETYLEFMPETFVDNWNLLKLYLYWDEDEQEWFPESIGIDDFIAENSSGIPTSSAVRYYVQNNVIHHLQAPVAAASDLRQGLYVADSDLRLATAYEQVQLYSGDFIVVETGTSPIDYYMVIVGKDSTRVATYTNSHLYETTYAYKQNPITTLTEDLDVSNNSFVLDEGLYYSGSHTVKYYDSLLGDYEMIVPQNALFFYSAAYSTFETINLSELGIPDLIMYKHKWDNGTSKWVPDIETYTAFEGTDGNAPGTKGLVPAPLVADTGKFLKADGTWATPSGGGGGGSTDYSDLTNKPQINSVTLTGNVALNTLGVASDSTFTGTDGLTAGAKGLVPAPATTDNGKFLKADGTWGTPAGEANVIESISVNNVAQTVVSKNVDITVPQITYSTTDLTPGTSSLATGTFYFVYE